MIAPAEDVSLTFHGPQANVEACLGEGWHGPEATHRWTDGLSSVVRLPPMRARPYFALTLKCEPLKLTGVTQRLSISLNGATLQSLANADVPLIHVVAPGALVRQDGDNLLVFDHPDAVRPHAVEPGNKDDRLLAVAFLWLELAGMEEPPMPAPRLLPPAAPPAPGAGAKALVEMFQSFGFNCVLGMMQRYYGAEPYGLLRFASIRHDQLMMGLKTRFAGVGDIDKLSFHVEPDGQQLMGRHDDYGLYYHTFKLKAQTDVAELAAKEAMRLKYLARLLFEQLERNEKIFVRHDEFGTLAQALTLHETLRRLHRRARLFLVNVAPRHAPERVGRVVELRPGLYRGYVRALHDPPHPPDRGVYEEWLKLCATLAAYERAGGGA